ncbi:MAG: FAD-binding protein, partial [Hyphomicrobiales bacterium]
MHCDLLVVGGQLAGLSAAIAAASAGADVILCDREPELGERSTISADPDLAALNTIAKALPNLRIMTDTVCNGWFADNWLPLIQGKTLYRCRARQVIFATGQIEQPAVFRGNDLPGIIAGGTAWRLIAHYGVRPGRRAVVYAGTPEGLNVASMLDLAGTKVSAIILPRPLSGDESEIYRLRSKGIEIVLGQIDEARGRGHLQKVVVCGRTFDCDLLVVSVGSAPAWQLPAHSGAQLTYDDLNRQLSLASKRDDVRIAGSVAGHTSSAAAKADGCRAGTDAAIALGYSVAAYSSVAPDPLAHCDLPLNPHPKGRDFVDFDEDLQIKDIINSVREGYRELELVKRFSTVGMGPSQGRHSALTTARIVAKATDRTVSEVGVTTARPPFGPELLGVLAGHI